MSPSPSEPLALAPGTRVRIVAPACYQGHEGVVAAVLVRTRGRWYGTSQAPASGPWRGGPARTRSWWHYRVQWAHGGLPLLFEAHELEVVDE
jgi:hypothetical protein